MDKITPYAFMPIENCELPPSSNRGADSTSWNRLVAVLDWLQVTFKDEMSNSQLVRKITSILGLENAAFDALNGQYGYKKSLHHNGIFILFDGSADMGVHLQITGGGCRYLETLDNFDWVELFNRIILFEFNITRIDIALDDYFGYFTIPQIIKKIKRNELISKFKEGIRIETINLGTGETKGNTIYFGKPSARLQVRMYEKNHERKNKGVDYNYKIWNRIEIQARKERANTIFNLILKNEKPLGKIISGILNNYLRFIVLGKDKNKSRSRTWINWEKFIHDAEKISLTHSEPEKDLEDTYNWIIKQVSTSLSMLDKIGVDAQEIIEIGNEKLKEKHIKKINDYIKKTGEKSTGNRI